MSSVEEYKCVFCKESFDNKEDLQIHFRKHGDPNYNQSLKNQGEASSSKKPNEQEEVGCDVCSEVFPTISKAITHKHKVHRDHDTKYFCPWCGKQFTLKHLYTKHLQANHANAETNDSETYHRTLHCDCCNVDFYCQAALMSHNKFFHRQDELPMVGQSKKLKLYDKEVVQIHYCSFCGEEYENKINLHKHINDEHSDENQSPDDILRCPLCDAIFFHLDAYEVHLTFHSVEDIYTEKDEIFDNITDFSLESIPPKCEKVESYEPEDDAQLAINTVGIEHFLQLALESEGNEGSKHKKKHKKHKKSKKGSITLDEFLNMNTDVFGEGLDIQGVEEVPTQAISKKLKVKQPQNATKAKLNPELEKLKKQGIVIKKKNNVPHLNNKRLKISPEAAKSISGTIKIKNDNDTLSKLISQNQSHLKIVRKSSQGQPTTVKEDEEIISKSETDHPSEDDLDPVKTVNNGLDGSESNNETFKDKNLSAHPLGETQLKTSHSNSDDDVRNYSSEDANRPIVVNKHTDSTSNNSEIEEKAKLIQSANVNELSPNAICDAKQERFQSNLLNNGLESEVKNDKNSLHNENDNEIDKKDSTDVQKNFTALKHLSHLLTIKSVNTPKSSPNLKNVDREENASQGSSEQLEENAAKSPVSTTKQQNEPIKRKGGSKIDKIANTLKNLRGNITIKTVGQTQNAEIESSPKDDFNENEDNKGHEEESKIEDELDEKMDNEVFASEDSSKPLKQLELSKDTPKFNKPIKKGTEQNNILNSNEDCSRQANNDILKRLTNITAKPLKNTCNQIVPVRISPPLQSKIKITKQINEDNIEVFNIEDSDSDEKDPRSLADNQAKTASIPKVSPKNIIRNIPIKSAHQQKTINKSFTKTITKSQTMHNEQHSFHSEESYNKKEFKQVQATKSVSTKSIAQTGVDEKNLAIKNVLKSLGKNITVKSRTSSPSLSIKSQDNDTQDSCTDPKDDDSDIESEPANVKITELDTNASDYEHASDEDTKNNDYHQNVSVQSPRGSENSNNEDNDENIDEEEDIECQIKANKLDKTKQNSLQTSSQNIEKLNVKPANNKIETAEEPSNAIVPFIPKNLGSQISVKPVKQKLEGPNENMKQFDASTSNQTISNQRMTNQTNTVNKAVTVKTFQTATEMVIEEITTTVTKTIKTVKQEVKNTSQCSSNAMVSQKVQGIRPSQPLKNYQGTKVKHMPPTGMRIRNPTQVRPAISSSIRNPNQVVVSSQGMTAPQLAPHLRPKANAARLSTPRMPAVKNSLPAASNQSKTIKISPNAFSAGAKRNNTDEASGPFSCFKKPKESLIPVSEVSAVSGAGQDSVQFTSSQVNKSNFVSTKKTVKGNTVVSQVKSEMNASSQQMSKLSNMSGIKVMRASQTKQQTIVQEKSEVTTPKRTLEAIEKLQKSGLLVKKPRLEVREESDHSEHDDDDDEAPYESPDEAGTNI